VVVALPNMQQRFDASLTGLQWVVDAYTLSFAVLLLAGAALGDRFGRRRMFVVGLAVFTAGSAGVVLAPSITMLVAARAVQGGGAAIDQRDDLLVGHGVSIRRRLMAQG